MRRTKPCFWALIAVIYVDTHFKAFALDLPMTKAKIAEKQNTPESINLQENNVDPVTQYCFNYRAASLVPHNICVYIPLDGKPLEGRNILMVFPGHLVPANAAQKLANLYTFYFRKAERLTPIMVSIFSGSNNSYTDLTLNYKTSLLESFYQEVLPALKSVLKSKEDVYAFGYSLGGYNIFQLQRKYPGIFKGISVADPAIFTISPFQSFATIGRYIKRNKLRPLYLYSYLALLKDFFKTAENWERNNFLSPQIAAQFNVAAEHRPYTFIELNIHDDFGFEEGGWYFFNLLKHLGYPIELELRPGGHVHFSFAHQINALINNTPVGL